MEVPFSTLNFIFLFFYDKIFRNTLAVRKQDGKGRVDLFSKS